MSKAVVGGYITGVNTKFKVVLLGETGVGKSSLVERLIHDEFSESQRSTVGASFLSHCVQVEDCQVNLDIWDTAGQERYRALAKMYYRGASAAIIVYDITNYNSFERAKEWAKELSLHCESPNLVLVLTGNKLDLVEKEPGARRVPFEEASEYAHQNDLRVVETSARDGSHVSDLFTFVAKELANTMRPNLGNAPEDRPSLPMKKKEPKQGGCCS
eukprot:TRINITY_DN6662_c0_g1_i1.p1 TRINITY_DN6662_c0_g1~~TRINITY_DN6662_c0_g1_i1.p1  ORF type:complete len:215 (+),score=34.14 TRINITY_DN6662_c0_g1_i1:34-678(+)